jgi:exonuclease III
MFTHNKKIFIWNYRGAASSAFYRSCKQYMDNNKPDIIVIMETRVDPPKLSKTIKLLGFDDMYYSNCRGYAGGILIAWRSTEVAVKLEDRDFQFIHISISFQNEASWFFTAVYASPRDELRRDLWDTLTIMSRNISGSWLIAGDFNDIASPDEKKGGAAVSQRKCNIFLDNINACKLMDVGAVGSRFTWRGPLYNGHMRIFERLDRALCNDEWRLMFPNAVVKVLPRIQFSDHHSIMVHLGGIQQIFGNRKFRFERAWTLHSTYKDVVHQVWDDQNPIPLKVKNMEEKLTHWRVHTFGSIRKQKIELMARIGGIQRRQHEGTSNNFLNKLEKTLQAQLDIALTQEEIVWFQKSRAQWIKDGDRNTRYYHLKTLNRRRKNKISMLKNEEGIWVEDEGQLKFMVNDFYHKLFEDPSNNNIWHQTLHTYPPLSDAEKEELKKDIQNIEVKESLFSMGAWKAPGPDGFPAGFYQGEWRKMEDSLCLFIRNTWKNPSKVEIHVLFRKEINQNLLTNSGQSHCVM